MNYRKWILLVIGLFLIVSKFFLKDNFNLNENDLIQKEITVKAVRDIGNKNSYDKYVIFSDNYPCEFIIDNSGGGASYWKIEDKVKVNDKLFVGINNSQVNNLNNKGKVFIYSLNKNNSYIFTFENYLKERKSRNIRYDILGYIILIFIVYKLLKSDKKDN